MFRSPGSAEIIRSHQKDDFYTSYLRNLSTEIAQFYLGPRRWISWRKEIDILADLGYFILSTFAGYQTIGEEYVNIIQVDSSKRAIPARLRRICLIALHVCTPYCLQKLLDGIEKKLRSEEVHFLTSEQKDLCLRYVPVLRQSVVFLHRFHLGLFYLQGVFYHIAKRITGIQYIKYELDPAKGSNSLQQSFKILGWISLVQLTGSLLINLHQYYVKKFSTDRPYQQESNETESSLFVTPGRKCSLCLEDRKHTTSTVCGHLFCWKCIHEWCQNKPECPLCREKLIPQGLICLQKYDPT